MKGKIYCIVDNTNYKYYIGSTTKNIRERLQNHEYHYNYYIEGKTEYTSSFEIIQYNNYSIYLIREIEYDDDEEDQLLWLERKFIEDGWKEGNCVNKILPVKTEEEIKEQRKQYKIDNRDKLLEQSKNYYFDNLKQIKERQKQYYINNNSKLKQKYIENSNKLNEKFECPCGGKYTYQNKLQHTKSVKHQKYITTI